MSYKKVDPKQDFIKLEHEIQKFWDENEISQKYLNKNKNSKKKFSFLDGPMTANNPMGVHHAWGRTLKDLWQRYYTMRGYKQRYQNGFDCQGLWVEVEVEKEKGFKNKKDIEKYGIDKFVVDCKDRVNKYADRITNQSKRLAQWMDWDNSYFTMSEENNYTIWHFLKVCHEKGWIYEGTDSVPWCPRCGTAISQHEMLSEEYKKITHDSVFFLLPVKSDKFENASLLVWTTTPWTIPANVAVAVDPKKTYALVEVDGRKVILLDSRIGKVFQGKYEKIKTFLGSELIDLNYEAPYSHLSKIQKEFGKYDYRVVASDDMILPVSEDEGTGLVHIAPGAGSEDFRLGKKYCLPVIAPIDEGANYIDEMGELSGKNAKEDPEIIFDFLKKSHDGKFLLKIEPYTHKYPTCWRCKTELVWRNVSEWYIAMDKKDPSDGKTFREKMMVSAGQINWMPEWGLRRELDWLENMHDWLISKKRYWGLALPIYKCDKCGKFEVIGSRDELENRAVKGWDEFKGNTPHRPWIDKVEIKCDCGENMKRILDVGNPWLDAGIVPFSTYIDPESKTVSYLTDKKYWQEWFPVDFITECFPGQFKNWFYALIAMSTALEGKAPYKNLLGHALVRDEKGEEMHKSKGNAIWFDDAAEEIGVDVMRFMYAGQNPVQNLNFGYGPAKDVLRRFVLTLWNSYSFFTFYANLDNWNYDPKNKINEGDLDVLDKWITSRFYESLKNIDDYLNKYNAYKATEEMEILINDISTWYLRLSRGRRNEAFYQTMRNLLVNISKMIAPVMPFLSESIYQNIKDNSMPESVHLSDWPLIDDTFIDKKVLDDMHKCRNIVEIVHSIRREKGIKVRQPLSRVEIEKIKIDKQYLDMIAQEVNVKEVELVDEITDKKTIFKKEEYYIKVGLETEITEDLEREGIFREITRSVKFLRKKEGLGVDDKVVLVWKTDSNKISKLIEEKKEELKKDLLISSFEKYSNQQNTNVYLNSKINGESITFRIIK